MEIFLIVIHVIISIGLILAILLQKGKGGGLAGSAFGGAGGSAVFGGAGAASFLTKVTTYLAVGFFITCISLWFTSRTGDVLPETAAERLLGEQTPLPLGSSTLPGAPQPLGESQATDEATPAVDVETTPAETTDE